MNPRLTLAAVLVLVSGVANAQEGAHATSFAPDGTITVNIDLVGGALDDEVEPFDEETLARAEDLAADIERYWNEGLARHPLCGLTLKLDLDIDLVDIDEMALVPRTEGYVGMATNPGRHTILYDDPAFGHGNPAWPEIYDPYDLNQDPGHDSLSPWQHDLDGVWSSQLEETSDYAHEVGHLMGLGDDYDDTTHETATGREGTLMGDGDMIDQALVDRMADVMRRSGVDLPTCWTGTIDLDLAKDYLAEQAGLPKEVCSGSWRVTPTFVVGADDAISGTAHAELASGPDCTFEIPGSGTTAEFTVGGTATPQALELTFAQTSIEPPGDWMGMQGAMSQTYLVDRVSPTSAEATIEISTTEAGPFPVTGSARIVLACSGCSDRR
jgi:hypothetical protein